MHTVLQHELIFTLTFVWPLSFVFSMLIHPDQEARRLWHYAALLVSGPIGTAAMIYRSRALSIHEEHAHERSSPSEVPTTSFDRRVRTTLAAGVVVLVLSGIAIFYHPGWSRSYYTLIEGHSYLGFAAWGALPVAAWLHIRRYSGGRAALHGILFPALTSVLVVSLNEMNPRYALNVPLIAALLLCVRGLRSSAGAYSATPGFRMGLILLYVAALTFATGAYIAEPFNSRMNNNMGLYVLYIHGGVPLLLLPFLVGMLRRHMASGTTAPAQKRIRPAVLIMVPAFILLLAFSSVYAHWKWFGPDSGSHVWPPGKVHKLYASSPRAPGMPATTYATHTGPPPSTARPPYPAGYEATLDDSAVCANQGCHPSLVRQWEQSSHRFAASNLIFRSVVAQMAKEKGSNELNYVCMNCHDPVGMLHPDRERALDPNRLALRRGITCKSCHTMTSVQKVPHLGDGGYALRPEIPYAVAVGELDYVQRWAWSIRRDLRLHFKNYSNPLLFQSGEFCAACHRATLPSYLTGKPEMLVVDLFSSWKNSPYAAGGVHCMTCHMPNVARDERNFLFPDHRFPGLNVALSQVVEADGESKAAIQEFEKYSLAWIQGQAPGGATGPFLTIDMQAPDKILPGETFPLIITTVNSRVGHYYPAGPSTLNEIWLEVAVTDAAGRVVFQSGHLDPELRVEPTAHRLGKVIVDDSGHQIVDCSVWRAAGASGGRRLEPFQSTEDRYDVRFPSDASGPLTLSARWLYRRANPEFARKVLGGRGDTFPIVTLVQDSRRIALAQ